MDHDEPMAEPGYLEVTKGLQIAMGGLGLFVLIFLIIICWMKCEYRFKSNKKAKRTDVLNPNGSDIADDIANANESEIAPINDEDL